MEVPEFCFKLAITLGTVKDKNSATEKLKIFQFIITADLFEGGDQLIHCMYLTECFIKSYSNLMSHK